MTPIGPPDAFEILRFTQSLHERLLSAQEGLAKRRSADREKAWMAQAIELMDAQRAASAAVLERCRSLPELRPAFDELAHDDQGKWADALEKLQAGITFHGGNRSPLLEALFPHQKWGGLRRASREDAQKYAAELERRAKSGYVTRMLAQEDHAFAPPVLEQIAAAYAKWQRWFDAAPAPDGEADQAREALLDQAKLADVAIRQAKLIAEAALLRWDGAFDAAGLGAKPRKRAAKPEEPKAEEPKAEAAPEPEKAAPAEPAEKKAKRGRKAPVKNGATPHPEA